MSWLRRFRKPTNPVPPAAVARGALIHPGYRVRAYEEVRAALALRNFEEAAHAAQRALDALPDDAALNALAGEAHLGRGDAETALDFFNLAQHYDPSNEAALVGRVCALEQLGRSNEIGTAYREFLADTPNYRKALFAIALEAERAGQFTHARELLERLIAHHPADPPALNLLGLLRAREFGDFSSGETLLRRALVLASSDLNIAANLGWVLAETGRQDEGLALIDRALAAQCGDAELRLMRAHIELKRGNLARGWQDYDARLDSKSILVRPFRFPELRGESPAGRGVLVYGEQGLGDQIMFASCLGDLESEAKSCVVDCDPRLVALFARSFPNMRVFGARQDDPDPEWLATLGGVDVQMPIGDLGRRYRSRPSDFRPHQGYLQPNAGRVEHYARRLHELGPGLKVGLSWRGGTQASRAALRSIGLPSLAPLIRQVALERTVHWISLQYTPCREEIATFREATGFAVHHWQEAIDDYDETAALVGALDAVVTVCTAAVHLAGALARPTIVMVPFAAEWRYGASGEAMPWYPTVRLLRQSRPGRWDDVMSRIPAALGRLA